MKDIYIFSGLGADKRVFKYMDFSGFNTTFIEWVRPNKNESIHDYAKRLTQQITTSRPTLIGISFGGIMATEVAKLIPTEKIILIASAQTKHEIPFYYRLAGQLKIHKLLPAGILKNSNFLSNWFFGTKTKLDKELLKEILKDTDTEFLKWAIDRIVTWQNTTSHNNVKHIHGTNDKVLPIRNVNVDLQVFNGGHFMTVNKADELSKLVRHEIG